MGRFFNVRKEPADPIYGLQVVYKEDARDTKINLSIGVLQDAKKKALRFSSVNKAIESLHEILLNKEYLPIDGLKGFTSHTTALLLGNALDPSKAYTAQTVGGTGALHIAARFVKEFCSPTIFISNPTWANHRRIFASAGLQVEEYPYHYDAQGAIDKDALLAAIERMPQGSTILFQASCHNPTGIDPTEDDWNAIVQKVHDKKLLSVFDMAYQGIGKGLDEDAYPLRLFAARGCEMLIASSNAKNFGLYNDRVGALTCVGDAEDIPKTASQIKKIIRSIYSSPPAHGAYLVHHVLENPALRKEWEEELKQVRLDLQKKRHALYQAMKKGKADLPIEYLLKTTGLFALFDMPLDRVLALRQKEGLYLCDDGRINIASVPINQVDFLAKAISEQMEHLAKS